MLRDNKSNINVIFVKQNCVALCYVCCNCDCNFLTTFSFKFCCSRGASIQGGLLLPVKPSTPGYYSREAFIQRGACIREFTVNINKIT